MSKTFVLFLALIFGLAAAAVFAGGATESAGASSGAPVYGGTLTHKIFWAGNGPNTWDTSDLARGIPAHTWTSPFAETLLIGDVEKYGRETGEYSFHAWELVPEPYLKGHLATSWDWPDPLTLVYNLREGVMWTGRRGVMESRELTADDVANSMNRTLQSFRDQGSVLFDYVKSVTARDRYTLEVKLNSYYADWAFHLGYRGIVQAIYPPEVIEKGPHDWRNAVGTGPFILTNYVDGSQATYERNPDYWGSTTIDGVEYQLPFVDKLVIPIIPDMSTSIAALRTGRIDWQINVPLEFTETLQETSDELELVKYLAGQTDFASLKMIEPPFDNREVRRALMIGADWDAIAKAVYGEADVHAGPMNALTPYYTPIEQLPEEVRVLYSADVALAKRMLADAGYPEGFGFKIHISSTNQQGQAAIELLKDQYRQLNVNVEMVPMESTQIANLVSGRGIPERPGDYDGSVIMTMATTTPWVAYDRLGLISSFKNPSRYDDAHFRDEFARASSTSDPDEVVQIIKGLAVHWLKDVPYLPFPNRYIQTAYWPWVRNYEGEVECAYYNHSCLTSRIWIDESYKRSLGY